MNAAAIVVAAGPGSRLGADVPKAFVRLHGQPLFIHSVRALVRASVIKSVIVALPAGREAEGRALFEQNGPWPCPIGIATGGAQRQDSVRAALALVTDADVIAVHDAARPFVSVDAIERVIAAAHSHRAAILAVPASDTLKQADADGWIEATPPRERLWLAQTPQAFHADLLRQAHARGVADGTAATDDAMLVEQIGVRVKIVAGDPGNRKITTPDDLRWAEWRMATSSPH